MRFDLGRMQDWEVRDAALPKLSEGGIVMQFEKLLDAEMMEAPGKPDRGRERPVPVAWLIIAAAFAWLPIVLAAWLYYVSRF